MSDDDCDDCCITAVTGTLALPHLHHDCPAAAAVKGLVKGRVSLCPDCYCYPCDVRAKDCPQWSEHCNARPGVPSWDNQRARRCSEKKQHRALVDRLLHEWSTVVAIVLRCHLRALMDVRETHQEADAPDQCTVVLRRDGRRLASKTVSRAALASWLWSAPSPTAASVRNMSVYDGLPPALFSQGVREGDVVESIDATALVLPSLSECADRAFTDEVSYSRRVWRFARKLAVKMVATDEFPRTPEDLYARMYAHALDKHTRSERVLRDSPLEGRGDRKRRAAAKIAQRAATEETVAAPREDSLLIRVETDAQNRLVIRDASCASTDLSHLVGRTLLCVDGWPARVPEDVDALLRRDTPFYCDAGEGARGHLECGEAARNRFPDVDSLRVRDLLGRVPFALTLCSKDAPALRDAPRRRQKRARDDVPAASQRVRKRQLAVAAAHGAAATGSKMC